MPSQTNLVMADVPGRTTLQDLTLPWRSFEPRRRKLAPEERLVIAVLRDALDCLEDYRFATDHDGQRLFRQTRRWFLTHDLQWPYSFERICEVLDLDPRTIRRRLAVRAFAERASVVGYHSHRALRFPPGLHPLS